MTDWTLICQDPFNIKHVKQTNVLCLKAVSLKGDALEYIYDQTEEICWTAIHQSVSAIKYVKDPTFEMLDYVATKNIHYLKFLDPESEMYKALSAKHIDVAFLHGPEEEVFLQMIEKWDENEIYDYSSCFNKWTDRIIEAALTKSPCTIENVKNPTFEQCLLAVQKSGFVITIIPDKFITEEMIMTALQTSSVALAYLPTSYFTYQNVQEHFEQDVESIQYFPDKFVTYEMWLHAISKKDSLFRNLPKKYLTEEICKLAVEKHWHNLHYIHQQPEHLCWLALKKSSCAIDLINYPTEEMCFYAINKSKSLFGIRNPTDAMIELALSYDIFNIRYVSRLKQEWIERAIRTDITCFPHINNRFAMPEDLKWLAIKHDPELIKCIIKPTIEMVAYALKYDKSLFPYVKEYMEKVYETDKSTYYEIAMLAVDLPDNIRYIKYQTSEICLKALSIDGSVFEHCQYHSPEHIEVALSNVSDPEIVTKWI